MRKLLLLISLFMLGHNVFSMSIDSSVVIATLSKASSQAVAQWPERYHDNVRTMHYPRADHELFMNPAPLILPQRSKADSVQFILSSNSAFPNDTNTITSKFVPWAIFMPHKKLTPGTWHWKYRAKSKAGVVQAWSTVNSFTVKPTTPVFVTPPVEKLIAAIPTGHPRIFAYLQEAWEQGRSTITTNPEYKDLISRNTTALNLQYTTIRPVFNRITKINDLVVSILFQNYVLTGDVRLKNKMLEMVRHVLTLPDPAAGVVDNGLYKQFMTMIYDQFYDDFTADERLHIEKILVSFLEAEKYGRWYLECHVYENHGLQYDIVDKFRTALALYGKYPIAREYLEYCYETWTGRSPMGGFVRDGGNFNGIGYFGIDGYSIHYMTGIFSYFTGSDFYTHPWLQELGKVALYCWPPNSYTLGFGDGHSTGPTPVRAWSAFIDLIARNTNDPYGQWYVNKCANAGNDYFFRMYRLGLNKTIPINPNVALPANRPKALWLPDCGEAYMHSDIANTNNNLGLSLRASTYGGGSHCIADNNSFVMSYKGQLVYQNTGYYAVGDRHTLLSSRHTQAQNSMLIDGVGQPMSTLNYANLARVLDGKNISYALGDASNAYAKLTDYAQWTSMMASQNITQTPEFGFGETSLSRFRRHVLLLHPDKVLIYDDLEAGTPVRWDWLLHSANEFTIEEPNKRIVLEKNMTPLSSVESGNIINGCGVLSFDYIQSESDNVNLEVYANDKLVSTKVTTNEKGVLKNSGSVMVNVSGSVKLKFRQKNIASGQVGINNIKWTSFSTGINDLADQSNLFVIGKEGSMDVTTSRDGLLIINTLLGQQVISQKLTEGKHTISLPRGIYMASFVCDRKTKTLKVVVK